MFASKGMPGLGLLVGVGAVCLFLGYGVSQASNGARTSTIPPASGDRLLAEVRRPRHDPHFCLAREDDCSRKPKLLTELNAEQIIKVKEELVRTNIAVAEVHETAQVCAISPRSHLFRFSILLEHCPHVAGCGSFKCAEQRSRQESWHHPFSIRGPGAALFSPLRNV